MLEQGRGQVPGLRGTRGWVVHAGPSRLSLVTLGSPDLSSLCTRGSWAGIVLRSLNSSLCHSGPCRSDRHCLHELFSVCPHTPSWRTCLPHTRGLSPQTLQRGLAIGHQVPGASGRAGLRQADPHSPSCPGCVPWRAGSFPVVWVCERPWVSCQSTAPFCSAPCSCVPVLAASDPEDTRVLKATCPGLCGPSSGVTYLIWLFTLGRGSGRGCVPCVLAAPALVTGRDVAEAAEERVALGHSGLFFLSFLLFFFFNLKPGNETQRDGICSDVVKLVCLEVEPGSGRRTLTGLPAGRPSGLDPPLRHPGPRQLCCLRVCRSAGGREKHWEGPESLREE